MKKICFVTTISLTMRTFVLPVVRYFTEHTDWEITVVCNDDPMLAEELPAGVRFVPVPMKRGVSIGGIAAAKKLYDLFRRERFDLVQYSTPNAAFYASIAAWFAGIPHRKYHLMGLRYLGFSGVKKQIFKLIEQISCALSTDVECVSKSNMELGIREKVFPEAKTHVIFHGSSAGVDLQRFAIEKKDAWRSEVRTEFVYTSEQCVFGFAGRITGDKGINELLTAFGQLPDENCRLLLVGTVEQDGLEPGLLEQAESDPRITFHPFVNDVERYFAAMDVLVLPSHREGFGNIIIEAQAMGVPVIVTDIPGPVDAMEPENTGLLVPVGDEDALAEAMHRMYADVALRERMGIQGSILVEERFDKNKVMQHFLQDRKRILSD